MKPHDLGWRNLLITGGEPLIRGDFTRIYTGLHAFPDMSVSLNTNASLVSDETAALLAAHPPRSVNVSMYGWDEASFDQTVRTRGGFGSVVRGLATLRSHGVRFVATYPAISYLVRNRSRIVALARQLGAEGPISHNWDLNCHAYRSENANRAIRSLRLSPEETAAQILRNAHAVTKEVQCFLNPRHRDDRYVFPCLRHYSHIVIDAFENLLPCICLRKPEYVVSLKRMNLCDAISSHVRFLATIPRSTGIVAERCGHCAIRGICSQCPANSYLENGDVEGIAEFYCEVAHREAEMLGLLHDGGIG